MLKLILSFILCILILTGIAFSALIKVGINEEINSEVISEFQNVSFNVVKFSTELYNTGSVAYNARMRIFVYDYDELIFSGWSQEKALMPGNKKTFDIYWYANSSGNYETKLRTYFGNEVIEGEKKELLINKTINSEDIFEIINFRTYDDHVVFDIKSKEDAKDIVIIPYEYTPSLIFEQKTIGSIKKDSFKTVSISYYPSIWEVSTLKLVVVAEDGKYYSEKTLEMKKEEGIIKVFYYILDSLKLILH